ncbi:MAG: TetR/AcrR family transcriptional regulator [Akkermansiaceae bacterium]|nr:TetR/AcrR family transcriptional regulator [Armatimonadota bacterium]
MIDDYAQDGQGKRSQAVSGEREGGLERREQILLAAWRVLSQAGFEKITTRRIAEAAGINIATLHYHFGSKEAVLTETLRYAQRWTDQQMRSAIVGSQTSAEALTRAFAHTWKLMLLRPGVLRFDLVVRAFRDSDAKQEALSVYGTYRGFIEEIIEKHLAEGGRLASGLTAQTLADYMVTVVDGVILHHTLSGDDAAAERNLDMVRNQVLQLMGMPSEAAIGMDSSC